MQHLPLLASFSVLKPDFGVIYWAVILSILIVVGLFAFLAYRLLSGDRQR